MRELSGWKKSVEWLYWREKFWLCRGWTEPVWIDGKRAEADFRKMHISYLTVSIKKDSGRLEKETMMWQEKQVSAYEYLGAHLGYRFVVRDVRFCRDVLKIRIENTGFANLCEDAICRLQIYAEHGKTERMIETDPKKWECRKENTLEIRLAKEEQRKGTVIFCSFSAKRMEEASGLPIKVQKTGFYLVIFDKSVSMVKVPI